MSQLILVEATGIEPEYAISQQAAGKELTKQIGNVSALCLHGEVIDCQQMASTDITLARIVELWPNLSPNVQRAIYAICADAII